MSILVLIAFFLAFVFFIALLLIYGYLVVRKIVKQKDLAQKQQWLAEKQERMDRYLLNDGSPDAFIPKRIKEYEALEIYFSYQLRTSKDPDTRSRIEQFFSQYFLNYYKRRLHSGSWSQRMNTLYFVEEFKVNGLQSDLLNMLYKRKLSIEERSQIYLILSTFQYKPLFDTLLVEKEMPTFICRQILQRLFTGEHYLHYINEFETLPPFLQMNMIDVLREKNVRSWELLELLEKLMLAQGTEHEMLIRVLKTVAHFGYLKTPSIIIQLAQQALESNADRVWIIRLMLARVMGSIRKEEYLPYLEKFVSDPSYLVRNEAGRSLLEYRSGKEKLRMIAAMNQDSYAREIAEEWLERGPENV